MKKALIVLGIVVGVVVLGLGGTYAWLTQPVEVQDFEEPAPLADRQRNGQVDAALRLVGIDSSLVAIDETRAYVAYDAPPNATADADSTQAFVLGVLADAAPDTEKGIVVRFVDGKAVLKWEGDLVGARAVQAGTMDEATYLASVTKTTL